MSETATVSASARIPDAITDEVTKHEGWTNAAARYQEIIGQCTAHGTKRLVEVMQQKSPIDANAHVLDNGTGTGSIVTHIKQFSPEASILATDISSGMLEKVESLQLSNVSTKLEDAVTLAGLRDNDFSHVLTSFMIQFIPDPQAGMRAMYRVLKPGGYVGVAIYSSRIDPEVFHQKACTKLNPAYQLPKLWTPAAWNTEGEHRDAMIDAGFRDVETEVILMPFECNGAEQYLDFVRKSLNPVATKLQRHWEESGGDLDELYEELKTVVEEEYDINQGMFFEAVLAWGRK